MLYIIAFILLFLPLRLLFPTKIIGKGKMPHKGKKCIVSSNHYSNFDGLIYEANFLHHFRFMAKSELFKNKFFSWILKGIGLFPINRKNFGPSDLKRTLSILKENKQVFIFPEGTRNKSGSENMLDVKAGIITFASKSDSEIVPMLIYKKPKIFSRNYIIVGKPFKVTGDITNKLTKEEINENIKIYTNKIDDLRKQLDEIVMTKQKIQKDSDKRNNK